MAICELCMDPRRKARGPPRRQSAISRSFSRPSYVVPLVGSVNGSESRGSLGDTVGAARSVQGPARQAGAGAVEARGLAVDAEGDLVALALANPERKRGAGIARADAQRGAVRRVAFLPDRGAVRARQDADERARRDGRGVAVTLVAEGRRVARSVDAVGHARGGRASVGRRRGAAARAEDLAVGGGVDRRDRLAVVED